MAVKVWMCENYEHTHERETVSFLIGEFKKNFEHDTDQFFHIICNVRLRNSYERHSSSIDIIVVKADAIVVVEMKAYADAVIGNDTEPWKTVQGITVKGGREGRSPFGQVRDYRNVISNQMDEKQTVFMGPETPRIDWRRFIAGLVVLDPDLDDAADCIEMQKHAPWFRCVRKSKAVQSVLKFTARETFFTPEQMEKLIKKVFRAQEAKVVDNVPCYIKQKIVVEKSTQKIFVGSKQIKEEVLAQLRKIVNPAQDYLDPKPPINGDHMVVRVFDCKTDKLSESIKRIATHEYLVCIKVADRMIDPEFFKNQVNNLFKAQATITCESSDCFYVYWQKGKLLQYAHGNSFIDEIGAIHFSDLPLKNKYSSLWDVLDRMTKEFAEKYETQFTSLFSRLKFICGDLKKDSYYIGQFRIRANRLRIGSEDAITEAEYLEDLKSLCDITCVMFGVELPSGLAEAVLNVTLSPRSTPNYENYKKQIRMTVDHWDENFIYGYADTGDQLIKIDYKTDYDQPSAFASLDKILFKGVELNILTPRWDNSRKCWNPSQIVFAPDYLISTTELSGCVTEFIEHPLKFLLNKLQSDEPSSPMMMGNFANQFFYDLMGSTDENVYTDSQTTFFRENAQDLCAFRDDSNWPMESKRQFENIKHCIQNVLPTEYQFDLSKAIIEASFVSESMGIQGRMDCLYFGPNPGEARVLELKSGKWDNFRGDRPKINHNAQVALYRDILFYLSGTKRDHVKSILFYSKTIPEGRFNPHVNGKVFSDDANAKRIKELMQLRNCIVASEYYFMKQDGSIYFDKMTTDSMLMHEKRNDAASSPLWNNYHKPGLEKILTPITTAAPLAKSYFFRFLSFQMRERILSKVGDEKIGSLQGIAAAWNTSTETKLTNGTILIDLKVKVVTDNNGIEFVILNIPRGADTLATPNFRKGDSVLFYPRNDESDNITNKIILEGDIETLSSEEITIRLRNKVRSAAFDEASLYALEPGIHSSSSEFRGLLQFLTGPERRRNLLLKHVWPEVNSDEILRNEHLKQKADDELKRIVLEAKQAKDYYLLMGPPGTGKTSYAIRWMTEEFLTDPHKMILLVAYTNRAVDEICEMLGKIESCPAYLRIGRRLTCAEDFQNNLEEKFFADCSDKMSVKDKLDATRIVVGTLSSLSGKASLFKLKHFDVAIVDEASQILEPQLLQLFCGQSNDKPSVDKFILVGDHKQLPAVVQQTAEQSSVEDASLRAIGLTNCRNSLFERLYQLNKGRPGIIGHLSTQWRMHPVIADFASSRFYGGKLKPGGAAHQLKEYCYEQYNREDELEFFVATHRLGFIPSMDPPIEDSHKANRHEAKAVARLVKCIYELYEKNGKQLKSDSIGIVVPFRNQIAMIRGEVYQLTIPDEIKELISNSIDTIERYQGSSRDVILFSTTISRPYQKKILSVMGDDDDGDEPVDRKLNVAITRPRKQLFLIGNAALLREIPVYDDLIDWLIEKGGELNLDYG
ncbi:MAG: AAA domain-containing protein [Kiritimatiellia bacterium]